MQDGYWLPWYDNMQSVNEWTGKFFYYLFHPGEALALVWNGIMPLLYWIAVICTVVFLIYYAATRSQKCLRIAIIIIITYVLIKGIDAAL
jgi:O-antigen ligase